MAMIDIGVEVRVSTSPATVAPVTDWTELKQIVAVPAMMQPAARIGTDFVGDEYTGEILGKRGITGLDFTLAFDGHKPGTTFNFLFEASKGTNMEPHYLELTLPDMTKIQILCKFEVSIGAINPSAEIDYTLSVVALDPSKEFVGTPPWEGLINIVSAVGGTDPLAAKAPAQTQQTQQTT